MRENLVKFTLCFGSGGCCCFWVMHLKQWRRRDEKASEYITCCQKARHAALQGIISLFSIWDRIFFFFLSLILTMVYTITSFFFPCSFVSELFNRYILCIIYLCINCANLIFTQNIKPMNLLLNRVETERDAGRVCERVSTAKGKKKWDGARRWRRHTHERDVLRSSIIWDEGSDREGEGCDKYTGGGCYCY